MDRCPYYTEGSRCTGQKCCPRCECFGDITECELNEKPACALTPAILFKTSLRIALKEYIKDYIRIFLIDDYIRIDFYHLGDYSHCHIIHNIESKINGMTVDECAAEIAEVYKGVILNRYFKK